MDRLFSVCSDCLDRGLDAGDTLVVSTADQEWQNCHACGRFNPEVPIISTKVSVNKIDYVPPQAELCRKGCAHQNCGNYGWHRYKIVVVIGVIVDGELYPPNAVPSASDMSDEEYYDNLDRNFKGDKK